MKKIIYFILFIFLLNLNLFAYEYAIDKNGISFYDRSSVSLLKDKWTFPSKETLICSSVSSRIKDPLGGRGILTNICFSYYSPIGICQIKTYNFDQSNWAYFKIKNLNNTGFEAYCYKIYTELNIINKQ